MYSYINDETGESLELVVSIAERDNQPGLTRQMDTPRMAWAPTATGGGMK